MNTETMQTQEQLVDNMINTLVINADSVNTVDISSIIDDPFFNNPDSDLLSLVYRVFHESTDVPLTIPVFSMLSFISAWLVKSNTTYLLPKQSEPSIPNTWVMALAPTGASKTMSYNTIKKLIPLKDDKPVIEQNLFKASGPVGFFDQLLADDKKRGFLFIDEASELFDSMNQKASPMADMKEYLLLLKDGGMVSRITSKRHDKIEDYFLTAFLINTIAVMAGSINDTAMISGLFRRFQVILTEKDSDPDRHMTKKVLYGKTNPAVLKEKFEEFFTQDIKDTCYVFDKQCEEIYVKCFDLFWWKTYRSWMEEKSDESYYRTYMMEAWKYAIIHHVLKMRTGQIIQPDSMQWALRVVSLLLNSLKEFIKYRALNAEKSPISKVSKPVLANQLRKIYEYVIENENKAEFGLRNTTRKFAMTNEDLYNKLNAIKLNVPNFTTKLFALLEKSFKRKGVIA